LPQISEAVAVDDYYRVRPIQVFVSWKIQKG